MAKSNLQLLQEAIAVGDLEKAKLLTDKIAKASMPKKAPRRPAKASVDMEVDEAEDRPKAKPRARKDVEIGRTNESSYIASSKRNDGDDILGNRHFVGADGKHHTYARRVSMVGTKFVNKFDDSQYKSLTTKEQRLEKQISKIPTTPRPGQKGSTREKAQKVKAQCSICNDWVSVWPWEAERIDEEANFRCSKKRCVKAR